MNRAANLALLACVLAGGCEEPSPSPPPTEFIAVERDFADFEASWTRFDRGPGFTLVPHPEGHSFVYLDELPPAGSTSFPLGTRIVRVTETPEPPETWEVHAMVKRGGGFNADGASGWEFFELVLEPQPDGSRVPRVKWRGTGPPDGDGYTPPDGGTEVLGCNHCHGAFTPNDSIIGEELDLALFP